MIIMRIKGGLGNQLFQYAAVYALSKRLGQEFSFDPCFTTNMTAREYRISQLCVDSDKIVSVDQLPIKVKILKNAYINKACRVMNLSKCKCRDYLYWLETRAEWQPDFFTITSKNLYIDGYFQSENYFKEYRSELLKQFKPKYVPEDEYLKVLKIIEKCNSVAVHVRRSDFKKDNCKFHYLLDESYYRNAITEMRRLIEKPVFFWFSDDMEWVKKYIGNSPDFRFVGSRTQHGDIDDMMLMKNCKHIITANSTFSWWAAWLNEHENAIRIAPKKPFGMEGMIPKVWARL